MNNTALETEPVAVPPVAEPSPPLPDASVLVDQVPEQLKAPRVWAGFTVVLGLIFLGFCLQPVWHTDVWGHVVYGRLLWERGSLPTEEPLLALAQGMPFVDTAWLSQLFSYGVLMFGGLAGLQGLTAISVTLACGLLLSRIYTRTHSPMLALLGAGLLLWFDWGQFIVLRPQLFALACFVMLLTRLTGRPQHSDWFTCPLLFVGWANLHGSFPVGLALLLIFTIGRAADGLLRGGTVRGLWRDGRFRRLVLLTELAFAATLINPYGPLLYREVLTFSSNPNVQSLTEWQSLEVRTWAGGSLLGWLALLAVLYRVTPRRIAGWEPLALIGLAASAFWSTRMITWLAPVAAYLTVLHMHAIWRRWRHAAFVPEPSPRAGLWTVAILGLAWIFFGYSPLGLRLIHGRSPKPEHALSDYTPLGAVDYLRKSPPVGQVFNIYEWGDYLQWAGPDGIQVFVNSHAHTLPTEVWKHYLQVIQQNSGWPETLDRYGVNTVVLDRAIRENLIKALKDDDKWRVGYEDHVATVFLRKQPIRNRHATTTE